jgi:hypothetical protein
MPEKPPYLGLLNAISLAETSNGVHLRAWADATDDADLACTLRFVAARETSHGEVFCRRLSELGFDLRPKHDAGAEKRLAKLANPKIGDLDKLPDRSEEAEDPFADIRVALAQDVYDPMTANMLSWYIAEEDDSGRRLRDAFARVRARTNGHAHSNHHTPSLPSADAEAIMACMTAGFARLEKSIEKLAKAVK